MKDWREGGRIVEAQMRDQYQAVAKSLAPTMKRYLNETFSGALVRWIGLERNPNSLLDWLRSDRPIGQDDKLELADAIEKAALAAPTAKRGRPRNHDLHSAVYAAQVVYRRWRKLHEASGFDDYGIRSAMKDEAIEIALRLEGRENVDPVAVRDLWERPAYRQK
ncbi:hypothetical protein [Aliihoeflea sp. 40Bstr573]|uniref:hypothetical protein n=1 Tax=Aliihoeflea sp. 40Bstr573 TaxID=2696467 RepID=UPI002095EED3|nr:hypothetical protein [Aliihoeflea sp. 40Bstr573]MCO6385922.1 hypothetical protein [Aliihoeflea sp. 40Bstr573]